MTRRLSLVVFLGGLACATNGTPSNNDAAPEHPGGNCSWAVKEGGTECLVSMGGETRTRIPGTTDGIEGTEGYGEFKWKCGEKREVCGSMVECTCPFPVMRPDGGS
jgi:hypothetical protein